MAEREAKQMPGVANTNSTIREARTSLKDHETDFSKQFEQSCEKIVT